MINNGNIRNTFQTQSKSMVQKGSAKEFERDCQRSLPIAEVEIHAERAHDKTLVSSWETYLTFLSTVFFPFK